MSERENHPVDLSGVTLAVLAGGEGQRMGKPKALLRVGERSILAWLLDRWRWPGPTMLVTAPAVAEPPDARLFDRHVIDPTDGLGPLRGILTALENLATPLVAIVTVDMPMIRRDHLQWYVERLAERAELAGVMGEVSGDGNRRIEPFPSAFRKGAAAIIAERLNANRLSVHRLCEDASFAAIQTPPQWPREVWTNVNHPHDLEAFLAMSLDAEQST